MLGIRNRGVSGLFTKLWLLSAALAPPPVLAQPVSVQHIEVVQVIQNSKGSVPLLEGKPTAVRVFLSSAASRPLQAVLRLRRRDGSPGVTYRAIAAAHPIVGSQNLHALRQRQGTSLNFILPAADVRRDSATIEVLSVTDAVTGTDVVCSNCPHRREVLFRRAPDLRLLLVSYRYMLGGKKLAPREEDLAAAESWIERRFPIRRLIPSRRVIDASATWDRSCSGTNDHVASIRASDMANKADPRTHYLAIVSDAGLPSFAGCSNIIPADPNPSAVATAPAGKFRPDHGWDTDGTYADWYAGHELGHTLGRRHPHDDDAYPYKKATINKKTDYVGWDVETSTPYGDDRTHDMMSYSEHLWPSDYTYERMYERLLQESPPSGGSGQPPMMMFAEFQPVVFASTWARHPPPRVRGGGDSTKWVLVRGTVDLAGRSGDIQEVVDALPDTATRPSPRSSVYLRTRLAGGAVLDSIGVRLQEFGGPMEQGEQLVVFQEVMLLDSAVVALDLVMDGGVILDRQEVSKFAPNFVGVDIPAIEHDGGPLVISWDATDSDKNPSLSFTVLVWFDDEVAPETLAAGLTKYRIEIDSAQRMGRTVTRVEIVASDGIRVDRYRSEILP